MARIPGCQWKPLPLSDNDPPIIPIGLILHVDAGNAADLFAFFRDRSGGIESTGHIRLDGHSYQYRDTEREADANYKGNSFIKDGKRYGYVSFETQGYGDGEWTKAQLDEIKRIIVWMHKTHGMPYRVCRHPQDPGVGYHTLFGAPSAWTPVSKSCPGPRRKQQFHNIIVPWLAEQAKAEKEGLTVSAEKNIIAAIAASEKKIIATELETRARLGERDNLRKKADAAWRREVIARFGATEADLDAIQAAVKAEVDEA